MTNHPNRGRTYWINSPRGFQNEYDVGVATTRDAAKTYEDRGYERIKRDQALREMAYRGDAATQSYVSVSVDGVELADASGNLIEADGRTVWDRFELVAALRDGATLKATASDY
jgi:hypothetical protein